MTVEGKRREDDMVGVGRTIGRKKSGSWRGGNGEYSRDFLLFRFKLFSLSEIFLGL